MERFPILLTVSDPWKIEPGPYKGFIESLEDDSSEEWSHLVCLDDPIESDEFEYRYFKAGGRYEDSVFSPSRNAEDFICGLTSVSKKVADVVDEKKKPPRILRLIGTIESI